MNLKESIVIDKSSMSKRLDAESELLIERYVASFEKLDEMVDRVFDDVARQLTIGDPTNLVGCIGGP